MTNLAAPIAALTTAAVLALGAPAYASHGSDDNGGGGGDGRVVKTGSCSDGARWKLKVKKNDGRLEVEGEVDSSRSGQTWRWRLMHNGSLSASGVRTTGGRSGSFEVRRSTVNSRGTDSFVFRARNTRSGELCVGTVNH